MLGYTRFFLAILVVLSHFDIKFYGLDIGKFAVFCFFTLAGYVSVKILTQVFSFDSISFAKDRFLRIYPSYFITLTISYIFFLSTQYGNFDTNLLKVLLSYIIIPLNYVEFINLYQIKVIDDIYFAFLLPPFWSLGVEIQAYILLCLLLVFKKRKILRIFAFGSFAVFSLANLGVFEKAYLFNYMLLPGNFFTFYLGVLLYERNKKEIAIFVGCSLLQIFYIFTFDKIYGFSREAIFAIFFILSIITLNQHFKFKAKYNFLMGNLSYHIFLNHFLFIYLSYFIFGHLDKVFVLLFSIITSALFLKIDKIINKYRIIK